MKMSVDLQERKRELEGDIVFVRDEIESLNSLITGLKETLAEHLDEVAACRRQLSDLNRELAAINQED